MGKKKQDDKAKKEKPIFGSGAEPMPEPKEDGIVKCVCTVPCAWHGYHDAGDKVFVKKELLEGDQFFKAHFKAVDGVVADAEQNGEAADGEGEAADGEDGQGELGLR